MKAFHFRLEPVLRVRRLELERAAVRLAEAERSLERALERTAEWRRRCGSASAELAARLGIGLRADEYRTADAAQRGLQARLAEAEAGSAQARGQLEESRWRVFEARTRVRALERLRERALREHQLRTARREQRELDEVAVQRAATGRGPV